MTRVDIFTPSPGESYYLLVISTPDGVLEREFKSYTMARVMASRWCIDRGLKLVLTETGRAVDTWKAVPA